MADSAQILPQISREETLTLDEDQTIMSEPQMIQIQLGSKVNQKAQSQEGLIKLIESSEVLSNGPEIQYRISERQDMSMHAKSQTVLSSAEVSSSGHQIGLINSSLHGVESYKEIEQVQLDPKIDDANEVSTANRNSTANRLSRKASKESKFRQTNR